MSQDRIAELIERAEAEAVWGYEAAAPPELEQKLGMARTRIGGGVVLAVRDDVTNYWSKALGFGFDAPVTADLIAEITAFYREHEVQLATIQLAPAVIPADWDAICEKEGITAGTRWLKLARLAGLVESAETDLRIDVLGLDRAEQWASVLARGFGMPEEQVAPMMQGVVGQPGWTAYGAWDGDQLIASATLFIKDGVAAFTGAATLPEYRGRGAQSALLAARARQAVAQGVKWLSAETWKPGDGQENSSLNNMLRTGFEVRYTRQNWTWRP